MVEVGGPGTLEQSNVSPSQVLIEMVEAQRLYDMRTKLVATAKELDEGGAVLGGTRRALRQEPREAAVDPIAGDLGLDQGRQRSGRGLYVAPHEVVVGTTGPRDAGAVVLRLRQQETNQLVGIATPIRPKRGPRQPRETRRAQATVASTEGEGERLGVDRAALAPCEMRQGLLIGRAAGEQLVQGP